MNLHRPRLACFSLFLNLELFWRNNKTIIEFGFRGIRRILQISEGVIHLGRQHPPRSAAFFISYESRIQSLLIVPLRKVSLNSKLSQPTWTSKKIAPPPPLPHPCSHADGLWDSSRVLALQTSFADEDCVTSQKNVCVGGFQKDGQDVVSAVWDIKQMPPFCLEPQFCNWRDIF